MAHGGQKIALGSIGRFGVILGLGHGLLRQTQRLVLLAGLNREGQFFRQRSNLHVQGILKL